MSQISEPIHYGVVFCPMYVVYTIRSERSHKRLKEHTLNSSSTLTKPRKKKETLRFKRTWKTNNKAVLNTSIYLRFFYKSRFEEQVDFPQGVEIFCVPKLFGRRLDQQLLKLRAATLLREKAEVCHQRCGKNMGKTWEKHGKKNINIHWKKHGTTFFNWIVLVLLKGNHKFIQIQSQALKFPFRLEDVLGDYILHIRGWVPVGFFHSRW